MLERILVAIAVEIADDAIDLCERQSQGFRLTVTNLSLTSVAIGADRAPVPVSRPAHLRERRLCVRAARGVRGRRRGRGHASSSPAARATARGRARRRRVRLLDGDALVAEARPAPVDVEPPAPVSVHDAEEARERHVRASSPDFRECYVCGVREDGLEIRVGPVAGREPLHASPIVLPERTAELVWAAIDCPGAYAVGAEGRGEVVLGRMTARVSRVPERGRAVRGRVVAARRRRPQALRGDGALRRGRRAPRARPADLDRASAVRLGV